MDDLIQKWLWMETMNYALGIVEHKHQICVYPDYESHRHIPYTEFLKNIFAYALGNWQSVSYQGSGSGHNRFALGYSFAADSSGVTGEYKNIKVGIKWTEVKRFIQKMLSEETKDRQIDLLELLAEVASGADIAI